MSASEELEKLAVKYASEAIQLDQQGSRGLATAKFQRAIEILLKLCALYPNSPQNKIYMEHVESYKKRIESLSGQPESQDSTLLPSDEGKAKFDQLVLTEKPSVRWSDIANLKVAKKAIEESIVFPAKRPDLFPLGWPGGILFFGPPGCGKTLLAAAIATEIDATFFCVDAASIMSKWLGESEKNVAQLFKDAKKKSTNDQPAIIFIDEIDSLVRYSVGEVGGEARARNQFLKEMDGILDKNQSTHSYVIGATNKPWALDHPFIRRFQKRIFVPLPDAISRSEMFKLFSKNLKISPNVDFNELSKMTAGYSGSDIRDIFQSAQIKVVRDLFENGNPEDKNTAPRYIDMNDFSEIFKRRKPSISPNTIRHYEKWFEEFKAL
ncbi:MAG: AAA family ATPase [Candidatus Bathyarchaeota archaeon]|nr:AAA family ATPase [Candidatus Bathyarchaeota archaeon]